MSTPAGPVAALVAILLIVIDNLVVISNGQIAFPESFTPLKVSDKKLEALSRLSNLMIRFDKCFDTQRKIWHVFENSVSALVAMLLVMINISVVI